MILFVAYNIFHVLFLLNIKCGSFFPRTCHIRAPAKERQRKEKAKIFT